MDCTAGTDIQGTSAMCSERSLIARRRARLPCRSFPSVAVTDAVVDFRAAWIVRRQPPRFVQRAPRVVVASLVRQRARTIQPRAAQALLHARQRGIARTQL